MKFGKACVEQIAVDGTIVKDNDVSLSPGEMEKVLKEFFPKLEKAQWGSNVFEGEYKNRKYAIRCKNVTYLGNPHPHYKKRIQIPEDLEAFYKKALAVGTEPILLGIYTYKTNILFVDFRIDTYINKKAHNSSAHVYADDLCAATVEKYFQKIDFFGNTVTVFQPDIVNFFLDELFQVSEDTYTDIQRTCFEQDRQAYRYDDITQNKETIFEKPGKNQRYEGRHLFSYVSNFKTDIVPKIRDFFEKVHKEWHGIECYKEMIETDYKNKYQPEWAAFYLEYIFEKYIKENDLETSIKYYQDKKDGGIDLDLFFPKLQCFGDLKAHSEESKGIQGNDWDTIFSILNKNDAFSHIYYIVCEHSTEKDSQYDYEVTRFWNQQLGKDNLLSYHKRMKNNIRIKKAYILDINYDNKEYLTVFKQGINSNGKPRAPKIMIEQDNLKHFIIDEIIF